MSLSPALSDAFVARRWRDVGALVETHFFRFVLVCPRLLDDVFAAMPTELVADSPRLAMLRDTARAVQLPYALVDTATQARFAEWVSAQPHPDPADVLTLQKVALREHVALGRNEQASQLVDAVRQSLRDESESSARLADVVPSVLVRCGVAKLVAGERDAAIACFTDAHRWSLVGDEHPYARFAADHVALIHGLEQRYASAAVLLEAPFEHSEPGTMGRWLDAAGLLARLLSAVARLDVDDARRLESLIDDPVEQGELGWVAWFARAALAALENDVWPAIHHLTTELATNAARYGAGTAAGSLLRASLAALFQAAGDLRGAQSILSHPDLDPHALPVRLVTARQELLRGRPEHALATLMHDEGVPTGLTEPRHTPIGAVLAATAELAASGELRARTITVTASILKHHDAYAVLVHASPELRAHLAPVIGRPDAEIPLLFDYRRPVPLTRREQQVLALLRRHEAVRDIASALHISNDTVKTHLKALYRKLGARTREEAIWLGGEG